MPDIDPSKLRTLREARINDRSDAPPNETKRNNAEHLTQEALAAAIGVGTRTYQKWERGESQPTPANRNALAEALSSFWTRDGHRVSVTPADLAPEPVEEPADPMEATAFVQKNGIWREIQGEVQGDHLVTRHGDRYPLTPAREPWRHIAPDNLAALLTWRSRIPHDLYRRDQELAELERWAESGPPLSIRVVNGPGGVGKSRLVAELGDRLAARGWLTYHMGRQAGDHNFLLGEKGALIIIDSPEEQEQHCRRFLSSLQDLPEPRAARLRLLLVTRKEDTNPLIELVMDFAADTLHLVPYEADEQQLAWQQFLAAWQNFRDLKGLARSTPPIDASRFGQWLRQDPAHRRPLIINAYALHLTEHPADTSPLAVTVIDRIVQRERRRIANEAREHGMETDSLILLAALASLGGGLSPAVLNTLRNQPPLDDLALPSPRAIRDITLWDPALPGVSPVQPDLVAARFLQRLVDEGVFSMGEWIARLLAALPEDGLCPALIERLARLRYDALYVLQPPETEEGGDSLLVELAKALVDDHQALLPQLSQCARNTSQANLPSSLLSLFEAIENQLAQTAPTTEKKLHHLLRFGAISRFLGKRQQALGASGAALALCQSCSEENETIRRLRASALHGHALHLYECGQFDEAIHYQSRAIEVRRSLASTSEEPASRDVLSISLNSMAVRLVHFGRFHEALRYSYEGVKIREDLYDVFGTAYANGLALNLRNLALRFQQLGLYSKALRTARRSVAILAPLKETHPHKYQIPHAYSVSTEALILKDLGHYRAALEKYNYLEPLRKKWAKARFHVDGKYLASFFMRKSATLLHLGEYQEAQNYAEQALDLYTRLLEAGHTNLKHWIPHLHTQLSRLATLGGHPDDALVLARKATTEMAEAVTASPVFLTLDMGITLTNLALRLWEKGKQEEALATIQHAIRYLEDHFHRAPQRAMPDLAEAHAQYARMLLDTGTMQPALRHAEHATSLYQASFQRIPHAVHKEFAATLDLLAHCHNAVGHPKPADQALAQRTVVTTWARENADDPPATN